MHGECEPSERQPLAHEPLQRAAITTAGFACLSGLLLGYDIGITNGVLLPVSNYFHMNREEMEFFVGSLNLMALPGCLLGGYVAEWFGRRGSIAIGAVLFLIGNCLMTFAVSYEMLVAGRAVAGLAVGMTLVTEPLYTAETSPARLRGMLSTNVEVSFNLGIVLGFAASFALGDLPDDVSWRWMMGLCLLAPGISLFGVFCVLPESPRWLASRGRLGEAEEALRRLLGPLEAAKALESMRKAAGRLKESEEMTWVEMFSSRKIRWLMFLGGGIAFFSQATGIESIIYYSSVILMEGGLTRREMLMATLCMGLFKMAAIIAQGAVVDVVGRRPLLVLSSLGMGLSMLTLGLAFTFSWPLAFRVAPITTFVVLFSLGYGPIVYTLNAELYSTRCRSKGLALAMGVGRIISALVALSFLSLAELLTYGGTFMFFAAWGVVAAAFVIFLVPETKGRPLEDDEEPDAGKLHA